MTGSGVGLPADLSTEGWRIDQALNITHVFVIALCVIAFVWMVWAVWAGRKRERGDFGHDQSPKKALLPVGIAAFVFLVVDGHLFVSSTIDTHGTFADFERIEAQADTLRLQISARQWAWDARYAGSDGRFGTPDDIYVTSDIRLPKGRPVVVQLASVDVVHALYVPNLRVQVDVIPGRILWTWFEIKDTGKLDVACAQHCGVNHYKMAATFHVLEAEEFDRWIELESRYATKITAAGKELEAPKGPGLFPEFSAEPDIEPRGWGWPWQEGRE